VISATFGRAAADAGYVRLTPAALVMLVGGVRVPTTSAHALSATPYE